MTKRSGPLSDIRILDLGRVIAGPYASQMLADYGAEVIKIERPGVGDDSRVMTAGCLLDKHGNKVLSETSMLLLGNRGKRSVTLALNKPEGQQLLKRLAAISDVLVENFVPGTMQRFNIDYDTLKAINPKLIYVSISGWGQTGPYRNRPGFDAVLQAATGFMSVTGQPDGEPGAGPIRVGASVIDVATGMNAAFAILVALRHRDKTGEGQFIDVALYDTGIALQADNVQKYIINGDLVGRHGSGNYGGAPARAMRCADGEVFLIAGLDGQFAACCKLLGCAELPQDERFNGVMKRYDNREALYAILEPLVAKWRVKELVDALEKAQVPCSPVNDYRQLFDDPHTAARGMSVHLEHPLSERFNVIASPMKLSRTPARYERTPLLGEHSDAVLGELLQLDKSEIARLRGEGVV
jgi:crotonobetainyl-CoA:carnitine CoA-transferase CaiB-like acyl-CoA transferase